MDRNLIKILYYKNTRGKAAPRAPRLQDTPPIQGHVHFLLGFLQ
jgi:hypothetical protein